jgi:hypothetical protein
VDALTLGIAAVAALAVAAYAQYRIPFHTQGSGRRVFARLLLIAVGTGFGWVTSTVYTESQGIERLFAFLTGFGVVHIPAAAILFIKRQRGVTR